MANKPACKHVQFCSANDGGNPASPTAEHTDRHEGIQTTTKRRSVRLTAREIDQQKDYKDKERHVAPIVETYTHRTLTLSLSMEVVQTYVQENN